MPGGSGASSALQRLWISHCGRKSTLKVKMSASSRMKDDFAETAIPSHSSPDQGEIKLHRVFYIFGGLSLTGKFFLRLL